MEVYKRLIALRKETPTLVYGDFSVLSKRRDTFTFVRSDENGKYIIDCNLSDEEILSYEELSSNATLIFGTYCTDDLSVLRPYEARIFKI